MRIIRDVFACPPTCQGTVVALGNFDGVHLGHQAILKQAADIAKAANVPAAVMTFEPHPREFFAKNRQKLRIYSFRHKAMLLHAMGIKTLFTVRFNQHFASLSPQAFVENILYQQLNVRHVVTGYNFAFGNKRGGDTAFLAKQAKKLGFGFTACSPVHDNNDQLVSSSAIRAHLAAGDIANASALLGRPYSIMGRVRHGDKRGRTLGFPTANIALDALFKPRFGVYAVRMALGKELSWHDAVANLGIRPSFDAQEPLLEVHVFAMDRSMYHECVRIELVDFIREEKHFANLDALRLQIAEDCKHAKERLHASCP